jgi:alkylhydroperoxidase family enzyme
MSVQMSRFPIHDEETAPEAALPILKGALQSAGQLPNLVGVLAGSPAVLRAYARFRSELRHGTLAAQTVERIGLAVAEYHQAAPQIERRVRTARSAGLGGDEIVRNRRFESSDPSHEALLRWLKYLLEQHEVPQAVHEEVREAGWTDEELLEVIAIAALEGWTALVTVAGEVPADGSSEETRQLRAVA